MKVLITTSKHFASFQLASLLKNEEVLFGDHFSDFPSITSNSIAHQILKFCLDHQIERVFPLTFAEVEELRKSVVLFEEFGIELMISEKIPEGLNLFDKQVNSFTELSSGLIALGYPNQKIAIADASSRGELILIDDAVTDNLQVWSHIKSLSFTQLGKLFNQRNFQPMLLYRLDQNVQQFFMLIEGDDLKLINTVTSDLLEMLKKISRKEKMKGFYHVAIADKKILRIVNTTM